MQPMNYMIDVKSPFDIAMGGIKAANDVTSVMAQRQAMEAQAQQQMQMQSDLAQLAGNPKKTAEDFAAVSIKYPQLSDKLKNSWSMLNDDQKKNKLNAATKVYAALQSGHPEIASQLLAEQAQAWRNAGNEEEAKTSDTLAKITTMSPETALTSTGLMLASAMGPEQFSNTFSTLSKLPSEVRRGSAEAAKSEAEANQTPERLSLESGKSRAEIRNIDSQVNERSQRLGLDRDKLQSEVDMKLYEFGAKERSLDADARKLVNDSVISSVAAGQTAGQMDDLAGRLTSAGGGFGAAAKASEWLKEATGNQDAMTDLRKEYVRLKNSQAIKMLPPGPATDKDIALAMSGFPPETADANTISSFLRGMAKMNNLAATTENAKAEWVNSVGSLGRARRDIEVDGVNVPAGMSFTDFAKGYIQNKTKQNEVKSQQQAVPQRGYMRWATPQTTEPGSIGSGTFGQ